MRKSWRSQRDARIKETRRAAGRKSQQVQADKRMSQTISEWLHWKTITIKDEITGEVVNWKLYATNDPHKPLSVNFNGKVHQYKSRRRISPLMTRLMFGDVPINARSTC